MNAPGFLDVLCDLDGDLVDQVGGYLDDHQCSPHLFFEMGDLGDLGDLGSQNDLG